MKVQHVSASHSFNQTTAALHAARARNLCLPMAASKQPYNIGNSGPQLRHRFPTRTAHGFQSGRILSARGCERREGTQTCQASSQTAVLHSEEEARAKDRFLAQAVEGSGDQGLQGSTLNAALALLQEAASTRQVHSPTLGMRSCFCDIWHPNLRVGLNPGFSDNGYCSTG